MMNFASKMTNFEGTSAERIAKLTEGAKSEGKGDVGGQVLQIEIFRPHLGHI